MDFDVLIVGYGPVGAALAGLLGRYGVRALVVDKALEVFTAPRAIALDNEALRILQQVGVGARDFARMPVPYVVLRSPQFGEIARIDTSKVIDGHPMLVTFFQPELERALRANVERQATVTARTGMELVQFTEEADGIRALLRSTDGTEEFVRARYLVGADGASSSVRTSIGESFDGATYVEDWLIVDALDLPNTIDHVEFICDPKRPGPHMAAPGGRTRWEFMLHPGERRDEMLKDTAISELLRPWTSPGEYRLERKAVYRFHARACAHFSKGRVFLVGDAAHITPPFVGQGLVAGLRDAANLAWKLAWVTQQRAAASILDSYDLERRPHAKKMIDLARFAGLFIMPRSRAWAWLAHGSLKVLRHLPPFKSFISDFGMKPAHAYDNGLFARGSGRLARGAWLPQGEVRDSHGTTLLSDEAFGHGFTLLCSAAAPPAIGADTARRWERLGGTTVVLHAQGSAPKPGSFEDATGAFAKLTRDEWCVVVRPDRTTLHDGPVSDAERVLRESLDLLGIRDAAAASGGLNATSF
ncbi:bifunctional 3-(3-hydroxy-phenyl)propionate/3-hydroxycinnamic acid hydroxylase [Corallococcus sp. AS-1-6]|uniref:bifunctional 3-(3-hydroxy-phenyl)propionate/3-hydroxycinnamic acid hydroxylase n=1 Tax=Corallococcus sp. AS-1-6 TaxID=2874599 RepID=UPI001CBB5AC0|nr:bifunctional 3-(3-hydroxy-phenyl)propionate/3-hydroxycinnamic acid hydroxylase [Corallococcus sp. AS-1-6]MBZ4372530.1 bifunctional 3-(3-hydroxy-phenyl)propionate/3-hydroxycinnamic acid hydroxylase [Corallococcus sp. AS-1-6]